MVPNNMAQPWTQASAACFCRVIACLMGLRLLVGSLIGAARGQVRRMEVDQRCPQSEPFVIVRCTAHQHVGSQCMSLLNADNGDLICRSCPVYGTHAGACSSYLPPATLLLLLPPS